MANNKLVIFDTTLRDGEQSPGASMTGSEKLRIAKILEKLNVDVIFITNFWRDVEYYTGIVFEVFSGNREIARGGRYDDLLKSLGAKKNIPAVGAAINLKNIWKI